MPKIKMSFDIPPELAEELAAEAVNAGRTQDDILSQIVEEWLRHRREPREDAVPGLLVEKWHRPPVPTPTVLDGGFVVLECDHDGDGQLLTDPCPFCGDQHYHGSGGGDGHRLAHCRSKAAKKISHDGSDVLVGSTRISARDARKLAARIEAAKLFPDRFDCGPGQILIRSQSGASGTVWHLRKNARLASEPKTEAGQEVERIFDQFFGDIFKGKT